MGSVLASRMGRKRNKNARRRRKLAQKSRSLVDPSILTQQRQFSSATYGLKAIADPETGLRRLQTDPNSIVVAVKRACLNNGRTDASAGYCVYFSSISQDLNEAGKLPYGCPRTHQYASLYDILKALYRVHELVVCGEKVSRVVVKTDSRYLAKGFREIIRKLERDGYVDRADLSIENGDFFQHLHQKMMLLEEVHGISIGFCEVAPADNERAGRLARGVLRMAA